MVRRQIYLSEVQVVALKKESRSLGISLSELIRRVLDKHLSSSPSAKR